MSSRDEQKERYQAYRNVAEEIYKHHVGPHKLVDVPHDATVWMCDGGAFVAAVVWVPDEQIQDRLSGGGVPPSSDGRSAGQAPEGTVLRDGGGSPELL